MKHCCAEFEFTCYRQFLNEYAQCVFETAYFLAYAIRSFPLVKHHYGLFASASFILEKEFDIKKLLRKTLKIAEKLDKYPKKYIAMCQELIKEVIDLQSQRDILLDWFKGLK